MGSCLAASALAAGHEVTVVSGPVNVAYPSAANVVQVVSTKEMLETVQQLFPSHDGLIGAAAPCDYMPKRIATEKIAKDGKPLQLELVETPDIVATVANSKRSNQWVVGFALETEDQRFRAIVKMQKKCCDLMISNGPTAIDSELNDVEIIAANGSTVAKVAGTKQQVADSILQAVHALIQSRSSESVN